MPTQVMSIPSLEPAAKRRFREGSPQEKRRPSRMTLLLIGLLAAICALLAVRLTSAWQATRLREASLPQLEAKARQSPNDGHLLALLGGRLIQAGEYSAAADTLRRAVALNEHDNDEVWLNLAAARAAGGDAPTAHADFTLALQACPQSPALQVALVRLRSQGAQSDPPSVARAICPEGPNPLIQSLTQGSGLNALSTWWGHRHPEESGFATREEWARAQPNDAQAQRLWGLALLQNRRLPEAAAALSHAFALAPHSPAANLAMAQLLEHLGSPTKAVVQYVACLNLRPNWLPALLGLGRAALNSDLPKYALYAYQKATEIAPQSADAWIGLGRAGSTLWTHHNQSVSAFQTAAHLAPARTDFYTDYAIALRTASSFDATDPQRMTEAQSLLRRRIAAAPDDATAHYLLANILLHGAPSPSATAEAEAETRKSLQLTPGEPLAEIQLARLLLNRGETAGAIGLLTKALTNDPNNAPALATLAKAYAAEGQAAHAKRLFDQVNQINAKTDRIKNLQDREKLNLMDRTLHQQLAVLYRQNGRTAEADAEQDMAHLIQTNPQEAAAKMNAVTTTIQAVLKPH